MNGIFFNAKIVSIMPLWRYGVIAIAVTFGFFREFYLQGAIREDRPKKR